MLCAGPSAADPLLDQVQEVSDGTGFSISELYSVWQTFTPGVSGSLTSVDLQLRRDAPCAAFCTLRVAIVTTAGGVPSGTELGSETVTDLDVGDSPAFVPVALSGIELSAGTPYAIHLAIVEAGHFVLSTAITNPYSGGQLFADEDNTNGLDDPVPYSMSDGSFRTFMTETLCGNGVLDPGEGCDDGNTEDGDTCSSACVPVPEPGPLLLGITGVLVLLGASKARAQRPRARTARSCALRCSGARYFFTHAPLLPRTY
jgi:cysteine-rich repeat protein